jgi:hypothetical protein
LIQLIEASTNERLRYLTGERLCSAYRKGNEKSHEVLRVGLAFGSE